VLKLTALILTTDEQNDDAPACLTVKSPELKAYKKHVQSRTFALPFTFTRVL